MDTDRAFENKFDDATEDFSDEEFKSKVAQTIERLLSIVKEEGIKASCGDPSVYTGLSGIALLFQKLGMDQAALELLERAKKKGLEKKPRITFLCGLPGTLAQLAVLKQCPKELDHLLSLKTHLKSEDMPDELLYGRVGYLYALLYVLPTFKNHKTLNETIQEVIDMILVSGQKGSQCWKSRSPLMYQWHDKQYYGAAHGLIGILFVLLQAGDKYLSSSTLQTLIKPSIDYLLSMQFKSGNVPSSRGSDNDKLIHWCHGAPGAIHLFLKAYQVFQDQKYLQAALDCNQVIWQRGLLKKGYGLCHGVAGNAYAFLALYQETKDARYLRRAKKFGQFLFAYGTHQCRTPDRPYSLFEGLSGTIYFLHDMLDANSAKFPAFYLL